MIPLKSSSKSLENVVNKRFDNISKKVDVISKQISFTNIKDNFKLIYEIEVHGLNHKILVIDYDTLNSLHRNEIIEIRNILENLYDIYVKIHEHSLYPYINKFELREDLEPLTIPNVSKLKEFVDRINKVIISKSIEHKNREW